MILFRIPTVRTPRLVPGLLLAFSLVSGPVVLASQPVADGLTQQDPETKALFQHDLETVKVEIRHKGKHTKADLLRSLEDKYHDFLLQDEAACASLQGVMAKHAIKSTLPLVIPEDRRSYWLREGVRLENYQSSPHLPKQADFVVIGAGLTGSSAAYHISKKLYNIYQRGIRQALAQVESDAEASVSAIVAQVSGNFVAHSHAKEDDYGVVFPKVIRALEAAVHNALTAWQLDGDAEQAMSLGLIAGMQVGPQVVVIDRGEVSQEASGRNGGNIHSIPEVYDGRYTNIELERYEFTKRLHPDWPEAELLAAAKRQSEVILGIAKWTRGLIESLPREEGFDADFYPGGWLRIALDEEELAGLDYERSLLSRLGLPSVMMTPDEIEARYGYRPPLGGRYTPKDAIYHPYKFATGLMSAALRRYHTKLYTNTPVEKVQARSDGYEQVVTSRGTIVAYRVIAATNAFSRDVFGYAGIQPMLSQIMCTEGMLDKTRGGLVTEHQGYLYFQQPRSGLRRRSGPAQAVAPLLMGGPDVPVEHADGLEVLEGIHTLLLGHRDRIFPEAQGIPPSAEWVGAMGFTLDRLPAIGALRPGLLMAAGFNGFGGTYTVGSGKSIAKYALRGRSSRYVPLDIFDPKRFL